MQTAERIYREIFDFHGYPIAHTSRERMMIFAIGRAVDKAIEAAKEDIACEIALEDYRLMMELEE